MQSRERHGLHNVLLLLFSGVSDAASRENKNVTEMQLGNCVSIIQHQLLMTKMRFIPIHN